MNYQHDLGGNTQDLLARHQPHPVDEHLPPGDREAAFRRRGLRFTILGLTLMGATFVVAAALVYIAAHATTAQRSFGGIALLAPLISGAILAAVGLNEWQSRPMRSMQREIWEGMRANRERAMVVTGLVAAIPDRMAALELQMASVEQAMADVPNYGRGVIDGVTFQAAANREDSPGL